MQREHTFFSWYEYKSLGKNNDDCKEKKAYGTEKKEISYEGKLRTSLVLNGALETFL